MVLLPVWGEDRAINPALIADVIVRSEHHVTIWLSIRDARDPRFQRQLDLLGEDAVQFLLWYRANLIRPTPPPRRRTYH